MEKSEKHMYVYKVFYNEKTSMYGVCCEDKSGREKDRIEDITAELSVADSFCCMLNGAEIHPYHFYDMYEDNFGYKIQTNVLKSIEKSKCL